MVTESTVEEAALQWFGELGYAAKHGPHIAPGELHQERTGFGETILAKRLRDALAELNPKIPAEALDDAFRKVTMTQHPSLIANNRAFHKMLVDGVPVEYRDDGRMKPDLVHLVDWNNPDANDWLVVNQFTVIEGQNNRRPDIVIFVNGLPLAQEHILKPTKDETSDEKKNRYLKAVSELSKAFALSVPHDEALAIRDDVGFFQAVRAALAKATGDKQKSPDQIDAAIRQIISRAVASDKVMDIFAAAGLKKPDISILSDEFLAEVKDMPQKNLAVETLRKLLNNEIKLRQKKFLIQSRSFAELLEKAIRKYQNRAIEAAAVIEELIQLAKQMRDAEKAGEKLGLTDDEKAFYDALEVNDSAVKVMGEPTLTTIARELVEAVRNSVTIDWTEREAVRAKIRVMVKHILRKYGYPPDKQEKATQTVLQQAELLCADWAG